MAQAAEISSLKSNSVAIFEYFGNFTMIVLVLVPVPTDLGSIAIR